MDQSLKFPINELPLPPRIMSSPDSMKFPINELPLPPYYADSPPEYVNPQPEVKNPLPPEVEPPAVQGMGIVDDPINIVEQR